MLFYSGLESKNKQNTDNIKALQVSFLFPKFTLQPREFTGFIFYFWSFLLRKQGSLDSFLSGFLNSHKRFDIFFLCVICTSEKTIMSITFAHY